MEQLARFTQEMESYIIERLSADKMPKAVAQEVCELYPEEVQVKDMPSFDGS